MRKSSRIIVFSLVLGIILMIASLIRFEQENIPDAVTTKYGFPLVWIFHQTTSFAGPVDIWSFEWIFFTMDFIFWWIISIIIVFTWNKVHSK